jgi:hypothetical protein
VLAPVPHLSTDGAEGVAKVKCAQFAHAEIPSVQRQLEIMKLFPTITPLTVLRS